LLVLLVLLLLLVWKAAVFSRLRCLDVCPAPAYIAAPAVLLFVLPRVLLLVLPLVVVCVAARVTARAVRAAPGPSRSHATL
jgi:hypothetical protein